MGLKVIQQFQHRNAADPRGGKRAVAVRAHGAVDHFAVIVRADGNAAVNMAHNEIAVLVPFTHGFRMGNRNCLGIQHMGVGRAVQSADTRQAGIVAVFIHVGGVQRIGRLMIVLRKPPGQHNPQFRGVLAAAHRRFRIVIQLLVNDRHTAGLRAGAAAAADKHIDIGRVYPFLLQHIQDHLVPERHLAVHMGKLKQNRCVMELALLEQFLFVFKKADFGGCGTRVDNQ